MRLVAIDMDGTLLSSDKEISKENIDAINDAVKHGHVVMICSGRSQEDIMVFLKEQGLSIPFAGSNGAIVYADSKVIHSVAMDKNVVALAYEKLENLKHPFKIYTNKGIYSNGTFLDRALLEYNSVPEDMRNHTFKFEHMIEYQKKSKSYLLTSIEDLHHQEDLEIHKFFIFTPHHKRRAEIISQLELIDNLSVTSSGADNVEIMSIDGHKGNGIIQMAKYFNIPIEDTIAIGDNFNDVPMFETTGLSIAMANAEEEIKEMCDVVTLSNDDHGVAYAIQKYVLEED
jgi:Cof subfamily protein (haloacid dehalogenase superfamily)